MMLMNKRVASAAGEISAVRTSVRACDLGFAGIAWADDQIAAVVLHDTYADASLLLREMFVGLSDHRSDEDIDLQDAVLRSIENPSKKPRLSLRLDGTAFQRMVWEALMTIPTGEIRSYTEVAAQLCMPGGARAVANACAANRHAVLIPCHRVVRQDGVLSGFRWGIERKRALLAREQMALI